MESQTATDILTKAGIRPTANRILVLRELLGSRGPLSVTDLETSLETLEKTSIFRVVMLLLDRGIIHSVEDGRGIVKYEICHGDHGHCTPEELHPHFYCVHCRRTFCLDDHEIPQISLPEGYRPLTVNYMIKGLCPDCSRAVGQGEAD